MLSSLWYWLKAYLWFALAHTLYKLVFLYVQKTQRQAITAPTCKSPRADDKSWKHFVFGYASEFVKNSNRLHDFRRSLLNEVTGGDHGTINFPLPMTMQHNLLFTADADVVQHILKDRFDIWTKHGPSDGLFFVLLQGFLGNGIFTLSHGTRAKEHAGGDPSKDYDAQWFHQRKTAAGIFSRNNFRSLLQNAFLEKSHTLIQVLTEECEAKSGSQPLRLDMQKKFFAFTMDSIMQIFYGRDTHTLKGDEDPYATAFDNAHRLMMLYMSLNIPKFVVFDLMPFPFGPLSTSGAQGGILHKLLRRYSKYGKEFDRNCKFLREESNKLVNERKQGTDFATDTPDLLSLFLNAEKQKSSSGADIPIIKTSEAMTDVVLNFVIAGRDTTACCLSWTFYELARNPDVQDKLYEEIMQVLGEDNDPDYDSLNDKEMPYLNGILYESFRLHPPVPFNGKVATHDDVLPGGIKVPAGTWVFYYPWMMGRNEKRYPNPDKFDPTRWIPFKQPSAYEFPVFQAGPRICLGKDMAIFEAKLVTAMLIRKFKFKMSAKDLASVTYDRALTMSICSDKGVLPGRDRSPFLWMTPELR